MASFCLIVKFVWSASKDLYNRSNAVKLLKFLLSFINAYSEFMFTSALMKDTANQTLATGLRTFIRDKFSANWTQYSAAAVMSSVPIVALFLANQKFMAKGLTAGAVKG